MADGPLLSPLVPFAALSSLQLPSLSWPVVEL